MEFDRKLGLGTDTAHFLIFDPTLLTHTEAWPTGWYAEPPVWQHESAQGHIAAWCTGGDGGCAMRLTTGTLTEAEVPLAGASWTFALRSTGRVLIDGDYNLPGLSQSGAGPDESAWIDLPEGLWHVTVTAIEWTASDLPKEEAMEKFANYVVAFAPASDAPAPPIAKRPPDLICLRDEPACDDLPAPAQGQATRDRVDTSRPMPAGVGAKVMPPRGHFTSQGESDLLMSIAPDARKFDAFKLPYFIAPTLEVGAVGQICRLSGSGGRPGQPPRFSLTAQATAKITAIEGRLHEGQRVPLKKSWLFGAKPPPLGDYAAPLLEVTVALIEPDMTPPDDIALAQFRDALLAALSDGALAHRMGGAASYHHLTLAKSEDYLQLARFALEHLPMNPAERMALSAKDFAPRVRTLLEKLR